MNILGFWICQNYTRFWIKYFTIDVWQYYEYVLDCEHATVLNMLDHTMLWIKFSIINIWQGSEYASSSENTSVTLGSVGHTCLTGSWLFIGLLICQGLNKQGSWICQGYIVLCKLYFKDSQYFECLEFWIC